MSSNYAIIPNVAVFFLIDRFSWEDGWEAEVDALDFVPTTAVMRRQFCGLFYVHVVLNS